MSAFDVSPAALHDLEEIRDYIAKDSPPRATKQIEKLYDRFHTLASMPGAGRLRPNLGADVRSFAIAPYVVFYRLQGDVVLVMRVLHGARDVDALFS